MTPHEEEQLVKAIAEAVKTGVMPKGSARPNTCSICKGDITIGGAVVELPVRWAVCRDCFEVFRIAPQNRPME